MALSLLIGAGYELAKNSARRLSKISHNYVEIFISRSTSEHAPEHAPEHGVALLLLSAQTHPQKFRSAPRYGAFRLSDAPGHFQKFHSTSRAGVEQFTALVVSYIIWYNLYLDK